MSRAYFPLVACSCDSPNLSAHCDVHRVPPVCVCDDPTPNAGGECAHCRRPYKPAVPGFDACREAWRTHLLQETARA